MIAHYHINRVPGSHNIFKVVKFLEGESVPANIYFLTLRQPGEKGYATGSQFRGGPGAALPQMHCDCPNRRRGKHINDKHGVMVAKWLLAGEPVGYFDDKGDFHGATEILDRGLTVDEPANDAASDPSGDLPPEGAEGDEEHD